MTIQISNDCTGCGICAGACSTKSIKIIDNKAVFNPQNCIKCGHCFAVCPTGVVTMFEQNNHELIASDQLIYTEKLIKMRRSVRKFKPEPLQNEHIIQLLEITKYAPSSKNQRQVQFVVLKRPILNELGPVVAKVISEKVPQYKKAEQIQQHHDLIFRGAPHVVIAIVPRNLERYGVDDGVIALASFELYCQSQQIGTVWCGFLKCASQMDAAINEMMGLPDDLQIAGAMSFGWSDQQYVRPAARQDIFDSIKYVE